jgi:hypothetical protein
MIEQIENDTGWADFLITCDGKGCKSSLYAKDMLFGQAVTLAKRNEWSVRKVMGTWQHHCPKCRDGVKEVRA